MLRRTHHRMISRAPRLLHKIPQHRTFTVTSTLLLPPVVFTGLLIALWTWKSFMLVLFQNKIIYMPFLPPNARQEKISDYSKQCGTISWREERIRSTDGTAISLCISDIVGKEHSKGKASKRVYILYFQGYFSSFSFPSSG